MLNIDEEEEHEQRESTEIKKARHRLNVKRSYHRKLTRIQWMREEVKSLEKQWMAALRKQEQQQWDSDTFTVQREQWRASYTQVVQLKEQLRRQNMQLTEALAEYEVLATKMARFLRELEKEKADAGATGINHPTLVDPLTADECQEISRVAYDEFCRFCKSDTFITTGVSVFGWSDRRILEDGTLKFALRKTFHRCIATQLFVQTWDILITPDRHAKLYSMETKLDVAQIIDENNMVMCSVSIDLKAKLYMKSFFLVMKRPVKNGFMIICRPLARERLAPDAMDVLDIGDLGPIHCEMWLNMCSWILFEKHGESKEHSTGTFGGILPRSEGNGNQLWLLEVLFMALRWETQVFGPRFALDSEK